MKKFQTIIVLLLAIVSAEVSANTLVAYYSYTGNCRESVQTLTSQIEADVVEIQTVAENQDYNANGYALGNELLEAINSNPNSLDSYPPIKPVDKDCANYDNIIFVTPLWHSQMAAPAQTYLFMNREKLAGKNFAMIVSSWSSGISTVVANANRLVPGVVWMGESLWINHNNHPNRATLIENWINTLNFAESLTTMYITIDGITQAATLVDNTATQALVEKLQQAPVTVTLNSSGGFEIWGSLGFSLPASDEQITAQPGDVILYNGNNICLMYGSNSWSYTRLGHIDGLSESELRTFLKAGESNISVTLSLSAPSASIDGDVNGDNVIDVEDVNAAINIILKVNEQDDYPGSADMNADGIIDVEDVNDIINIILKN